MARTLIGKYLLTAALTVLLGVPALAGPIAYMAIDLGTLGGDTSQATGINDSGQVSGISETTGNASTHAFLYSGGVMTDLGTFGGMDSEALGINSSGQVVGFANESGGTSDAFLYSGGVMTDLGTLGGSGSFGTAINDSGQVTGYSGIVSDPSAYHAFLYSGGVMTDLGTLGGTRSLGLGINSSGQVTGASYLPNNLDQQAFLYSGGVMTGFGTESQGGAINDSGEVTGSSYSAGVPYAFVYSGGTLTEIVPQTLLSGQSVTSGGAGINNSGEVVGGAFTNSWSAAFLYTGGSAYDLNSLVTSGLSAGVSLTSANSISTNGWIAATGSDGHAYALEPLVSLAPNPVMLSQISLPSVPEPSTAVLLFPALAALALLRRRHMAAAYGTRSTLMGDV